MAASDQTLVCVKQVKQEVVDEWDESMPLPGDIIEGFSEHDADDDSFLLVKTSSELSTQLGKINSRVEFIWIKVKRGDSILKLQTRIAQQKGKGTILHRKYTIQAATDHRHVADLGDLTLKQCTELQEMSRRVVNIQERGFSRSGIKYDWKMKLGTYLPDQRCSVVSSILFMPLVSEHCINATTARCMAWFSAAISSGVPLVFVNIQTEQISSKGFVSICSVMADSSADRAGLRELHEEAIANGSLLVISRLEGKSIMPTSVCSDGLIHCCDQSEIKDNLNSAIDQYETIHLHVMAWPNQTRLSPTQAFGFAALLPPERSYSFPTHHYD
ncbi:hypothetical protein SESBI_12333 [Sesbania bispinosa]|nr:hypothetical protein SESBI_12333 [Sesbania bispinosa]